MSEVGFGMELIVSDVLISKSTKYAAAASNFKGGDFMPISENKRKLTDTDLPPGKVSKVEQSEE